MKIKSRDKVTKLAHRVVRKLGWRVSWHHNAQNCPGPGIQGPGHEEHAVEVANSISLVPGQGGLRNFGHV